jgi:hypothetical protein
LPRATPPASVIDEVLLACRQSPDWASLAADYRAGRPIDPRRFVPGYAIPGFPADIERIVATWNRVFRIDYFSCRAFIVARAAETLAAVDRAVRVSFGDVDAIVERAARSRFVLFFHDDDDFFAPDLVARLRAHVISHDDVSVFTLPRVHPDLFTFVRDGEPAGAIWGRRKRFDFRYQSNNYGIASRVCSPASLRAMKDHVEASAYANAAGLRDGVYPFPVSATVKTPCAASMLPALLADARAYRKTIAAFADRFAVPDPPEELAWLGAPLAAVAALFRAVADGKAYRDLPG